MIFEDILEKIGVFGRFQQLLYLTVCLRTFCSAAVTLVHVFFAGQSDHWCNAPELNIVNCTKWSLNENECIEAKKTVSIPFAGSGSDYEYENCMRYNLTGYEPSDWFPGWVTSDFTNDTMTCNAGWVYDTSQFETTIVSDFDLVCDKKSLPDLAQSIYFVGVLISSTFAGALSDRFGRYTVFTIMIVAGALNVAITGLSNSYIMFIIIRCLTGATLFSCNVVGFTLISEFVGPKWRTFVGNLLNFFWAGGYMMAAGLGYFIRQWRILSFVVASFPMLLLLFIPFLCESPRWLISKGQYAKAETIIRKVAKVNKKQLPEEFFNNLELGDQKAKLDQEAQEKNANQPSIIDIFRYPYLRLKTCVLMFIWFITSLVYYGLSLSAGDLGVDYYVSFFVSGAIELPAYLYVMFALDWLGRKPNLSGSMIGGGIGCLVSLFFEEGIWKTVIAMIGKFFITITFAIIYIFTVEQFPTLVRNVALGMCSAVGRIGSILAPLIFIIGDLWEPLPFVLFGVLAILGGLISLILPETLGKNLPETIEEGEQFGRKSKKTDVDNKEHFVSSENSDAIHVHISNKEIGVQASVVNAGFIPD